jgi:hypothetical protein
MNCLEVGDQLAKFPKIVRGYDSVSEAQQSIGRYLDFYNVRRPQLGS